MAAAISLLSHHFIGIRLSKYVLSSGSFLFISPPLDGGRPAEEHHRAPSLPHMLQ
jgi:hypothetical protein